MSLERKQCVVAIHAAAVIDHADKGNSAAPDKDVDLASAGIDAVLDQFLYYRGGTLDHFAGGDLTGDGFREKANSTHLRFDVRCLMFDFQMKLAGAFFDLERQDRNLNFHDRSNPERGTAAA